MRILITGGAGFIGCNLAHAGFAQVHIPDVPGQIAAADHLKQGDLFHLIGAVGKFDGALFVEDPDVLDLFQAGDSFLRSARFSE